MGCFKGIFCHVGDRSSRLEETTEMHERGWSKEGRVYVQWQWWFEWGNQQGWNATCCAMQEQHQMRSWRLWGPIWGRACTGAFCGRGRIGMKQFEWSWGSLSTHGTFGDFLPSPECTFLGSWRDPARVCPCDPTGVALLHLQGQPQQRPSWYLWNHQWGDSLLTSQCVVHEVWGKTYMPYTHAEECTLSSSRGVRQHHWYP